MNSTLENIYIPFYSLSPTLFVYSWQEMATLSRRTALVPPTSTSLLCPFFPIILLSLSCSRRSASLRVFGFGFQFLLPSQPTTAKLPTKKQTHISRPCLLQSLALSLFRSLCLPFLSLSLLASFLAFRLCLPGGARRRCRGKRACPLRPSLSGRDSPVWRHRTSKEKESKIDR